MNKFTVLSGMRPTGKLHLGHLLGALNNWKTLQNEYECLFMVADLHALTTTWTDTSGIRSNINEMVLDWLSSGVDPEKCIIFRQSQIQEHAELHLLLSIITPLGWLQRCPTYKEQMEQLSHLDLTTYGFLGYPVLQSADILLYKGNIVPVGHDQLPHLEITREIVRRFNHFYREIFPLPQPKLTQVPKLPGIDGRKMSKSYYNCIYLSDTKEEIQQKVREMITDPARIHPTDIGHPEVCTVFAFHQAFNKEAIEVISTECQEGRRGCVACKKELFSVLILSLKDIAFKRAELSANNSRIADILEQGRDKAKKIAIATMAEVREAIKM